MLTKFTQCSYRRLLSNYQTWSTATAILSRTYYTPSSPHLPLPLKMKTKNRHSGPEERRIDRYAREAFTGVLHNLLKDKRVYGLTDREDTYISVRELLSHRHFRMLSFSNLQKVVNEDRLHRFELLYQPLKGEDADSWWIRAKVGEEKDTRLDPIIFSDNVGVAIYGTTLEEWGSYISLKGISRRNDDYIQISRQAPVYDYLRSSASLSTQVLIYIDVKHAIDMGIRFFLSSRPSPFSAPPIPSSYNWPTSGASSLASHPSSTESNNLHFRTTGSDRQIQPPTLTTSPTTTTYKNRSTQILTPGNEFGFLPLECFAKVEIIKVKRKVLWPFDDEAGGTVQEQSEKEEGAIMKSTEDVTTIDTRPKRGYGTDHVAPTLDQYFIDIPEDHQSRVVHPDLKKEALAIFSI